MNQDAMNYLHKLYSIAKGENYPVYVVGGTVRDYLMKKPCGDFDVTAAEAPRIAHLFADHFKLNLIALDDTPGRETYRAIIDKDIHFDFCRMQGGSIENDLAQRDFTINAMAFTLENFIMGDMQPIDLHGGQADIKNRLVRVLPGPIFKSDPLRMLRAFRFAATLDFNIERETLDKIAAASGDIKNVASERITYELLIYLGTNTQKMKTLISPALMESIIPEMSQLDNALITNTGVNARSFTDLVLKILEINISTPEKIFRNYCQDILNYLKIGHRRALIKMAGLIHGLDDSAGNKLSPAKSRSAAVPSKITKNLRMSNADAAFIDRTLFFQKRALNEADGFIDGNNFRGIYNFVRYSGEELIPAFLLASSIHKAEYGIEEKFNNSLYKIYNFYVNRYLPLRAKPSLLNGHDLEKIFNLKPSPRFRTILDAIDEAAVLEVIKTKTEAEDLARAMIADQ